MKSKPVRSRQLKTQIVLMMIFAVAGTRSAESQDSRSTLGKFRNKHVEIEARAMVLQKDGATMNLSLEVLNTTSNEIRLAFLYRTETVVSGDKGTRVSAADFAGADHYPNTATCPKSQDIKMTTFSPGEPTPVIVTFAKAREEIADSFFNFSTIFCVANGDGKVTKYSGGIFDIPISR